MMEYWDNGRMEKPKRVHESGPDSYPLFQSSNIPSFQDTKGFTLIEVVVTLTIVALMLLIISGAFRLGLSSWERGESTTEEYQKLRAVNQMVSRQIKSIMPYKVSTQKAESNYLAFEGSAHSLKFVSALPIKARRPEGLTCATYEFKEGAGGEGSLVLYEQRVLNKDFFEERPKEDSGISLLEGITKINFEYLREEDQEKNQTEGWVEEWNAKEEKALPKALRITITQKSGKGRRDEPPLTLLVPIPAYRGEEAIRGPRPQPAGMAPRSGMAPR